MAVVTTENPTAVAEAEGTNTVGEKALLQILLSRLNAYRNTLKSRGNIPTFVVSVVSIFKMSRLFS